MSLSDRKDAVVKAYLQRCASIVSESGLVDSLMSMSKADIVGMLTDPLDRMLTADDQLTYGRHKALETAKIEVGNQSIERLRSAVLGAAIAATGLPLRYVPTDIKVVDKVGIDYLVQIIPAAEFLDDVDADVEFFESALGLAAKKNEFDIPAGAYVHKGNNTLN